jgi:hypothetical protein
MFINNRPSQGMACFFEGCVRVFSSLSLRERKKKRKKYNFLSPHSLSVTTVTLGSRLFFILLQINLTSYSAANKLTSWIS